MGHFVLQLYRKICVFFFSAFLVIRMFVKNSIFALQIIEKQWHVFAWLTLHKSRQICHICENLLRKKALAKEKYTPHLNSLFFINIIKDLQYIHPPKICMTCYLLMNTAFKRNSTIHLKHMKNCVPMMAIRVVRVWR